MSEKKLIRMSFSEATAINWLNEPSEVLIFTGQNGAGKSRILERILEKAVRTRRKPIAIANTPYDRFRQRGIPKLLARTPRLPERTIKQAIKYASSNDEMRLRKIPKVLDHCGYAPFIQIEVKFPRAILDPRTLPDDHELDDELLKLIELLQNNYSRWSRFRYDFAAPDQLFDILRFTPQLIEKEGILKRLGIISAIELTLIKNEIEIPLLFASSGELTLISTMAFLAVFADQETVILIDEPENSLHPKWQREYVSLLLQNLEYVEAQIIIATHSPILVSSIAELESTFSASTIFLGNEPNQRSVEWPEGVEGVLTEAFGVVTSKNHYLSVAISELLTKLSQGVNTLAEVKMRLAEYRAEALDPRQWDAIDASTELAEKIHGSADADRE